MEVTCLHASLDGTITVNPEGGLVLTSPTGTDAQVLCENTPISRYYLSTRR